MRLQFLVAVLFVCGSSLAFSQGSPTQPLSPNDYVELSRSGCLGTCSAYTVRINADGQVLWNGERFVHKTGTATSSIAPERAREWIEKFRTNNFWSLNNSYGGDQGQDLQVIVTTLHIGDKEKRVSHLYDTAPKWIRKLESEIDKVANTNHWITGNWLTR